MTTPTRQIPRRRTDVTPRRPARYDGFTDVKHAAQVRLRENGEKIERWVDRRVK